MAAPLYDLLAGIDEVCRFHTPGHKGHLDGIYESVAKYDITELPISDDLYCPTGAILQAELLAQKYFQTKLTVFSAGGATLCVQTALSLFAGKKIIMERASHVSAYNAAALLNIKPVFMYNKALSFPLPICPQQVDNALSENPDAAAVFITSPNYYGLSADLKSIKKICEAYEVLLIVDNSHGTPLFILDKENCAQKNADICIDSAHKTLPVLTGGAYLHFNYDIDRFLVKERMRLFGSSSPSFLILASLDYARAFLEDGGEQKVIEAAERTSRLKLAVKNLSVLNPTYLHLTILAKRAEALASLLVSQKLYYEMATDSAVVFLLSANNTENDFSRLERFFNETDFCSASPKRSYSFGRAVQKVPYLDAILSPCEAVSPSAAVGRVAARNVLPYPPGIPVLCAGEEVNPDAAKAIKNNIFVMEKDI